MIVGMLQSCENKSARKELHAPSIPPFGGVEISFYCNLSGCRKLFIRLDPIESGVQQVDGEFNLATFARNFFMKFEGVEGKIAARFTLLSFEILLSCRDVHLEWLR